MGLVWKWILGIVVALLISATIVVWYYSRNWKPIIETKLKEVVHNSTGGLYELRYDDLDLNIGLGNVTLTHAELIPDSTVYKQQVATQEAPNNRYHIKLDALRVRRFSLMDILLNKKLNIRSIIFDAPVIHMINEDHAYNDTIPNKPRKSFYESVKDLFAAINIRDIKVDNVKFTYSRVEGGRRSDIKLDSVNIKVHDVLVDETSLSDTSRLFYTKMVDVEIPGFEYELSDGYYKAKFDRLKINTRQQNVLLTKVVCRPKMNKSAFFKQKKQNVTMLDLRLDTLRFEGLDFRELIDNKQTLATKVQIKNGSVDLYTDKRYPKYPVNKIGASPHQKLLQMKHLLRLDTLLVDNVDVTYHEFSAKYGQEGSISFDHAKGILTNITNDKRVLSRNKYMRADLAAQIMGAGRLQAQFSFDMLDDNGYHTYSGTLRPMKASAFNRILRPLLNVELASGNIRKIVFDMKGNDYKNWGDFKFEYDDLKINLLHKPNEEKREKKLASFIVNQILINDSNPDSKGNYLQGKVNYTRVPEHTFFKTMWQSLLEGIKQCAGISPEREQRLMGTAEKAKGVVKKADEVIKKTGSFIKNIFKKKPEEDEEK